MVSIRIVVLYSLWETLDRVIDLNQFNSSHATKEQMFEKCKIAIYYHRICFKSKQLQQKLRHFLGVFTFFFFLNYTKIVWGGTLLVQNPIIILAVTMKYRENYDINK